MGTAALLAALLALRARRRFPQERIALGIALLCLLLIAPLPGAAALASHRLLLPLSLCLAYLGACSLERFRLGEVGRWPLLAVAAALAGAIAWGYLAHPDPTDLGRLAIFHGGWLRWQLRFLALAALLLAVTASWRRMGGNTGDRWRSWGWPGRSWPSSCCSTGRRTRRCRGGWRCR